MGKPQTPRQFLTRVILKTPVPLWMPSCLARGISHVILGQCTEDFELRCHLLRGLSMFEQEVLGESAHQVWPLTQLFLFPFCENSLICLEDKSMTPHQGNTILFRSSQQLPCLRLGPSKGILS